MALSKTYIDDVHSSMSARPWFGQLPEAADGDFHFSIISDRTGGAVQGLFEKGLEVAKGLNPAFLMSIGDIVEGYWSDEREAHEEWDRLDGLLAGVEIPLFQTVGNHDYGTEAMRNVWRERKGADYYAFRFGKTLFLVANTEAESVPSAHHEVESLQKVNRYLIQHPHLSFAEVNRILSGNDHYEFHTTEDALIHPHLGPAQIDFFEKVLAENPDVEWTFVFLHQPAWKKNDPLFARLESLLQGVRGGFTVVSGHVHYLELTEKRGSQYIQLGKTGGLNSFTGKGDIHHILSVQMRGGVPTIEVIPLESVEENATVILTDFLK
ncbi:metallophosphoesterase family protein [Gorillibacterium massiliense]|uniref:metallophosphoesterase family protein n=1 Tax=Gorillibacterium massiliense TaxID=1280390 RepID=UPI0004B2C6AD|nr:metallophosphoesterase [Gorillibacterium massiliense]